MSPGPKAVRRKLAETLRRKKEEGARERRRDQRQRKKEAAQDLQDGRYTGARKVYTAENGSDWLDGLDIGYKGQEAPLSDW
jgi:hypothetical protein